MVFMAPNVPGDRWRLSLTHELAHLVLEHHRDIFSPPQALEDEAFEFAREFLCPIREIGGHLRQLDMYRLAQLKKYWKVSMASMLLTAQKTGRISRHEAQWLWVKLRRGGKSEPVRIPEEHPQLIRTLVKQYLQATGDSFAGLSRRLHYRRPDEFREDFGWRVDCVPSDLSLDPKQASRVRGASFGCASCHRADLAASTGLFCRLARG